MSTDLLAPPTLEVVVRRRSLQGQSVAVLALEAADGQTLPAFSAGAHIDVHLPGGLVRPYSLCGNPAKAHQYLLGILKDPASRGGSVTAHESLTDGTRLKVSAPRNHFPLDEQAPHSVLFGGGIGVTPMLAMAWRLHALDRSFELHYCVRSRSQAAFLEELQDVPWAASVHVHADDEGDRIDPIALLHAPPEGTHAYVCGPGGFMEWVLDQAAQAGLPATQLHREYFSAPTQGIDPADNLAFEVEAQRSGRTVSVSPQESLLVALRRIGIEVPVSCEEGVCGTCACTVLEGTPDHRDAYLTDEEKGANDQILVCCSRARSPRLVLDL